MGARIIEQVRGTAPGLICPVGHKVIYAVPGVPYEMTEMMERAVLPDLQARAGTAATIVSRTLRTWGLAESTLAEKLAPRFEALNDAGEGAPTIAFLASGIEGIKVRITVKQPDAESARQMLQAEEAEVRALLGDLVFGADNETMEDAVGNLLRTRGLTLGLAESVTGGLVASRLTNAVGASEWFRGSIVSYASEVKFDLLGVPEGPVVSEDAAKAMAEGARKVLGADIGLAVTGVAGPAEQDGQPVGTVFFGLAMDGDAETVARPTARRPRPCPPVRGHLAARPSAPPPARIEATAETVRRRVAAGADHGWRSAALDRPHVEGLRWTTGDQWHVTLRFLGDARRRTKRPATWPECRPRRPRRSWGRRPPGSATARCTCLSPGSTTSPLQSPPPSVLRIGRSMAISRWPERVSGGVSICGRSVAYRSRGSGRSTS